MQDPPTLADILRDPHVLDGKLPADIADAIVEAKQAGWIEEALRRGSQAGRGLVLREMRGGKLTGRMIQWHPGGGHHGASPYWKVSASETGTARIGPQFATAPDEEQTR